MPNVLLKPYKTPSPWRRLAVADWRPSRDPQVYARVELNMTQAMAWLEVRRSEGHKVTPTHLVVYGLGKALRAHPAANGLIVRGKVRLRQAVDIFCQVGLEGAQPDLTGVVIRDADAKTPMEIATELGARAAALKSGKPELKADRNFEGSRKLMNLVPSFFLRPALRVVDFFTYVLNLNLGGLGIPRDPFGSAMVTSIGSLGIDEAWPPLPPLSRAAIILAVGKVQQRAVVVDSQVVAAPMMTVCVCFDHRLMDGILAGKMARVFSAVFENPSAI
jgi:pyruvate dehydrogenase E2 component (dihydrolipoamide acetyltransferase)